MTRTTHDELRELTGAYVLGVLGDDERRTLEAHMASCDECGREVQALREAAHGLAYAVPELDPPAGLRSRVLRAATAVPPAPSLAKPRPARALPVWLAVAASVAAAVLGLYALTLRERIQDLQTQLRRMEARVAGVEQALQVARASADRADRIAAVLEAPDVRRIDLAGQKDAPGAAGRAFWSPSRGLVFTATNLPPPDAGRQYQLWVITPAGARISAGLLDLAGAGRAISVVDPAIAAEVGTVAVTVEPAGGVPQPTGPIVLAGSP
jgi:anti-sigma-K factor RskA